MKPFIAKMYNRIAHEYVERHGYGEQLSQPSLKRFFAHVKPHARILDVGCGGGQDANFFTERGCVVYGIDISKEMVKLAKKYAPGATFRVADVMRFSSDKKFDGIWCCRVFHHVALQKQDDFLKKIRVLLKKGGILYLTSVVSEKKDDYEAFDSGNGGLLKKRLSAKSFKDLLHSHGFNVLKFQYWSGKKGMKVIVSKGVRSP